MPSQNNKALLAVTSLLKVFFRFAICVAVLTTFLLYAAIIAIEDFNQRPLFETFDAAS